MFSAAGWSSNFQEADSLFNFLFKADRKKTSNSDLDLDHIRIPFVILGKTQTIYLILDGCVAYRRLMNATLTT